MTHLYRRSGEEAAALRDTPDRAPEGLQGSTSANAWNGRPEEEHNRKLINGADAAKYRRMERSPSVAPFWGDLLSGLKAGRFAIEESEDTDPRAREYVETLFGIGRPQASRLRPVEKMLEQLLLAVFYGRSTHRIQTWVEDGLVKFRLHYTQPDSIQSYIVDEFEDLAAIEQYPTYWGARQGDEEGGRRLLAVNRVVHLVWGGYATNFEGIGLARAASPHFDHCDMFYNLNAVAASRYATPTPQLVTDEKAASELNITGEALAERVKRVEKMLKNYASHEQAWLSNPTWMDIRTFPAQYTYDPTGLLASISHLEHRIAMIFAAQVMLHGDQHSGGNRSLGQTQSARSENMAENIGQWLCGELNTQLLARLQRYQFGESVRPEAYARVVLKGLRLPRWVYAFGDLLRAFEIGAIKNGPQVASELRSFFELPNEDHEDEYGPEQRGPQAQAPATPARLQPPSSRRERPPANSLPGQDATGTNPQPQTPEEDQ